MKNETITTQEFEAKVISNIYWEGYGSDIGMDEWSFAKGFRDYQKLAIKLGSEYVDILNRVYKEKINR